MADIKARLSATLHKAVEFVQSEIAQVNEHAVGTRWELVNCLPHMVGSMKVQVPEEDKCVWILGVERLAKVHSG